MKPKMGTGGRHGSVKSREGSKRMKKPQTSMVFKLATKGKKK